MIPQLVGIFIAGFFIAVIIYFYFKNVLKNKDPTVMRKKAEKRNAKIKKQLQEMDKIKELDEEYNQLKKRIRCDKCKGEIFQPDAIFCPICGEKL